MRTKQHYFHTLSESKKALIITIEIIIGLIFSILSMLIFYKIVGYIGKESLGNLDSKLVTTIATIRTPFLTKIMLFFTYLGGPFPVTLATLLISLLLLKKHKKEAALFLITMIMGVIINASLKTIFNRPRPQIYPLIIESSKSFPSGHAMNNLIFYSLLVFLTYHLSKSKKLTFIAGCFSTLIVALISFSRIYLGAHYLSDILAGYVVGFWWITTVLSVAYTMILFNLFMPKPTLTERIIAFFKKLINILCRHQILQL